LNSSTTDPYDVVVIGGGPAGATAATFLQRWGRRCVLVEKAEFPRYHIGESLIPHTYGTLERLGLLPKLRACGFPKKYSVRFVSPSGHTSDPFYFSETIEGEASQTWQVERSTFDQLCLDNAREAGVEVRMATEVLEVIFRNGRAVGVRARSEQGAIEELAGEVIVDASGHHSIIGTQLGLRGPVPGLDKATMWSYYEGGERLEGIDAGETTVFMRRDGGWFWYIPLPDDIVSVGLVADPANAGGSPDSLEEKYVREVEACPPLCDRLRQAVRTAPVRGIPRMAYQNSRTAGDGWVMVGDAAAFLDPIYSSGLLLALASAEMAAACVHESMEAGDLSGEALRAFTEPLGRGIEVMRRLIHAFYDPAFSFREFVNRFPQHRAALIDCLVGDVIEKDMSAFLESLATMSTPPVSLSAGRAN